MAITQNKYKDEVRGLVDSILYERNLEYNNKVYVCYVDYEEAFDRVDWTKLMTILKNIGLDWRDRILI